MTKRQVDIGADLSSGFDLYKNNFGLLFVSGLIVSGVTLISCGLLYGTMLAGYSQMIRRLINRDPVKPTANDLFNSFSLLVPTLLLTLIMFIASVLLSFIPVIGRLLPLLISPLYIIGILSITFTKLDLGSACKKVLDELSAGEFMPFVQVLIALLIGSVGIIGCGIGVFFTYPLGICTVIYGYTRSYADELKIADAIALATPVVEPPPAKDDAQTPPTQP